jgi:hypothetical protein
LAWPTLEELKSELGITQTTLPPEREVILTRSLDAAIEQVLIDCFGAAGPIAPSPPIEPPIPYAPTDSQAAAALLLAVKISKAPSAPFGVAAVFDAGGLYVATRDPQYRRLLKGQRQVFGVA